MRNLLLATASISILLAASRARALSPFPEERTRKAWDRGCPDWPSALGATGSSAVKRNPEIKVEKAGGYLRVYADMRVPREKGETEAELLESVHRMLLKKESYPVWVMPGINTSPSGDRYFVTVDELNVRDVVPERHFWLTGPYTFHLLWFKRTGVSTIETYHQIEPPPACPTFTNAPLTASDLLSAAAPAATPEPATVRDGVRKGREKPSVKGRGALVQGTKAALALKLPPAPVTAPVRGLQKVTYRMVPRPELIKMMMAEVFVVPGPDEVELRMRLVAEPSSLVYQLMPEAMLRSQLDVRGRRIFSNFLEFRKTASVKAPSTAAATAAAPSAAPAKKR